MTQRRTAATDAAALAVCKAVADAIRELKTVPSGYLYAVLMNQLTLEQYEKIITVLLRAGVITRSASHLLTWIGK